MTRTHSTHSGLIGRLRLQGVGVLFGISCIFTAGCGEPAATVSQSSAVSNVAKSENVGALVMIPGVVGQESDLAGMRDGLCDAGCPLRIEIIPWETSAFQPIKNLTDFQANLDRAGRIARRLTQLRRRHPDQTLVLLGNSGGGGLAIMAVEMLPDDVVIDQLILTAAAVSHDYNLSRVRMKCRSIVNVYSRADGIVGWGTSLFGTIDRKNTLSAGHCGFLAPDGSLRDEEGLVQIEYNPEWFRFGHDGSHLGYRSRKWAEAVLSRWLMTSIETASVHEDAPGDDAESDSPSTAEKTAAAY